MYPIHRFPVLPGVLYCGSWVCTVPLDIRGGHCTSNDKYWTILNTKIQYNSGGDRLHDVMIGYRHFALASELGGGGGGGKGPMPRTNNCTHSASIPGK